MSIKVAIFASGGGTNAENLIQYFSGSKEVKIELVLTNNPSAFVIERAKKLGIATTVFNKEELRSGEGVIKTLLDLNVSYIVLAGFLWLIPLHLIRSFENKIINIHPALLPAYGGKGMYGNHVHKAVIENKEQYSGITIHLVDEIYDNGKILFQARCPVDPSYSIDTLAQKVHTLEYEHFPKVVENYILSNK